MVDTFPITEVPLGRVAKRCFGLIPAQRPHSEIPQQLPGTVLVFNTGDQWVQARGRLNGTESYVVQAVSVSVVQTRTRDVDVEIQIPSSDLADDFTVLCQFTCQVVDPLRAAEHGPIDVAKTLASFLLKDRGLPTKGQSTSVADVQDLRHPVDSRIRAYCDEASPQIPGMSVTLSSVTVLTPATLRTHQQKMRDARLARELAALLASHEDQDARALAARFTEPEYVAALAVLRDKVDLGKLVVDVYADRGTKDANILEFLKLLEKNGQLDRLPIDGRMLVNTLMNRLAGTSTDQLSSTSADATLGIAPEVLQSISGAPSRKEKRFAVDNDEE